MSSKDNENKNSQQLFSEDITKRLVKKILDDDSDNQNKEINQNKEVNDNSDFNIEYEEYDNTQFYEEIDNNRADNRLKNKNVKSKYEEDYDYDNYDDSYDDDYEEDYYDNYDDDYEEDYDYDDYNKDYDPRASRKPAPRREREPVREPARKPQGSKRGMPQNAQSQYRRNIERYGKQFFEEDYDDYDDNSPSLIGRVISFSIIIVLTISTAFLAMNLKATKKELAEAKAKTQELLDTAENQITTDALQKELDNLKAENQELKLKLDPSQVTTTNNNTDKSTQQTTKPSENNSQNNSNNSSSSEYIVKQGDVIWNISKKVYGNGSHFQKILDANGLKENSVLKPGQKLKIPAIS